MRTSRWAKSRRHRSATRLPALVAVISLAFVGTGFAAWPASAALPENCTQTGSTVTCTFNFTGAAQSWTVPVGVASATFDLYGAAGGAAEASNPGGKGAHVTATLEVTGGSSYDLMVGEAGTNGTGSGAEIEAFNGGGRGGTAEASFFWTAGGGGATDVRPSGGGLADRLVVAGGGGGGADTSLAGVEYDGGPGGPSGSAGTSGSLGFPNAPGGGGGGAGTSTGGAGGSSATAAGQGGSLGQGGAGADNSNPFGNTGAGGGGGYYGGGGGGAGSVTSDSIVLLKAGGPGGGGGGSSFVTPLATGTPIIAEGANQGHGSLVITYTDPGAAVITLDQPTITGSAVVGGTLTANTGTPDPSDVNLAYSWKAAGSQVGTASTYSPTASDVGKTITVTVTASKTGFDDVSKTSDPTSAVTAASFDPGPTASISGIPQVGSTLTAGEGSANPTPDSYNYQWFAEGSEISGATNKTFTLTASQLGKQITVRVTAIKAGFVEASDTSGPTAAVTAAVFNPGPDASITGTTRVGSTLTAHEGNVSPTPDSFRYQWFANGKAIKGATGKTLRLDNEHSGKTITVLVTAVKAGFPEASDLSEPTAKVTNGNGPK